MNRTQIALRVTLLSLLATTTVAHAADADWPQFRGPNRDGITALKGLSTSWPDAGPSVLWRAGSGEGFSGMSVADGRLVTMLGREGGEYVVALDAKTGTEAWSHRVDDLFTNQFGNGPRSTPTIDGDTIYTVGARGVLVSLDAATGAARWSLNLQKEFGARIPTWGISSSVLVDGDRLLLEVGGRPGYAVVALDKKSGEVLWHNGDDQPGYASPIIIETGGVRQAVFLTGTKLLALNPSNGVLLWERTWRTSYDVNASIPIFVAPNKLFISTGYDTGAALFTLNASGNQVTVEESWRSRGLKNQFQASIVRDGVIYGFDNTTFKALDVATGKERWKKRGWGHGSLIYADGHFIVLSDQGKLGLIRVNSERYEEVASAELLEGKSWTAPTIAGDVLFIRNEREIVALKITD